MTTNEPAIPIVSMKKLDPTVNKQGIYDFSQFGIRDEDIPQETKKTPDEFQSSSLYKDVLQASATETEASLQNNVNEYPFGSLQNSGSKLRTGESKKGPRIRVLSAFEDNANKPTLRAKGKFIDFTATGGPNIEVISGFKDIFEKENGTKNSTKEPVLQGIGLPNVQVTDEPNKKLAPSKVKPFEPFLTKAIATTKSPVISTVPALNTREITTPSSPLVPDTEISASGKDQLKADSTSKSNSGSTSGINTNDKNGIVSDVASVAKKVDGEKNKNVGGPMVANQINTDDITNDLFSHRVTGPVPDGIPPGEKLKIDSLYPDVPDSNQGFEINMNSGETVPTTLAPSAAIDGKSNNVNSVSGANEQTTRRLNGGNVAVNTNLVSNDNTLRADNININQQMNPNTNINGNNAVANSNQIVPAVVAPGINTAATRNSNQATAVGTGSVIGGFNNRNGVFVGSNNARQPIMNNIAPGQNWRGQFNPNIPSQSNSNFAGNGRQQQIINGQVFNNGMPVQGLSVNTRVNTPLTGNINNQNTINRFQNAMVNTQNRQILSQGGITTGNNNPNVFGNFQNRVNFQGQMRPIPGATNIFSNGVNNNQFNNNFQRRPIQIPFNSNNNGFLNNPNGLQNAANGFQRISDDLVVNGGRFSQNNIGQQNAVQNDFIDPRQNGNNIMNGDQSMRTVLTTRQSILSNRNNNIATGVNVGAPNTRVNSNERGVADPGLARLFNAVSNNGPGVGIAQTIDNDNQNAVNLIAGGTTGTGLTGNENVGVTKQVVTGTKQTEFQNKQVGSRIPGSPISRENSPNAQNVANLNSIPVSNSPGFQQNANNVNEKTVMTSATGPQTNQGNTVVGQTGQALSPVNGQRNILNSQGRQFTTELNRNNINIRNSQPNQNTLPSTQNQIRTNRFQNINTNFQGTRGQPLQNTRNMQFTNVQGLNRLTPRPNLPGQNFFPNGLQNMGISTSFQNGVSGPNFPAIPFGQSQQRTFNQLDINARQGTFPGNLPPQFVNRFQNNFG